MLLLGAGATTIGAVHRTYDSETSARVDVGNLAHAAHEHAAREHASHHHHGHPPANGHENDPATQHRLAVEQCVPYCNWASQASEAGPETIAELEGAEEEKEEEESQLPKRPGGWPPRLGEAEFERRDSGRQLGSSVTKTLTDSTQETTSADTKRRKGVMQNGVKQWIYTNWIKDEIEREAACLELPFTVLLLVAFSVMTICYIGQETVTIVEEAIVNDVAENANFAWAHNFGHKGIDDVNSLPDFWSWCRLGFIPLVAPSAPWMYSEDLSQAVPHKPGLPEYDVGALPTRWPMPGHRRAVPARNDYLRYNRIIGGFRFRQTVAGASDEHCIFPGDGGLFRQWLGKPCTGRSDVYLPPDLYATESLDSGQQVEWFLSETEGHDKLIRRAIDMEDGCTSARFYNRSCLCESCAAQNPPRPWLTELTTRVEISFIIYNAQYGLYCMAVINFWFSRTGQIHKLVNIRGSWAGLLVRDYGDLSTIALAGVIWVFSSLYVAHSEAKEIIELLRTKLKPWYLVLVDDYIGFWNCVDWFSIANMAVITGLFVRLNIQINSVNEALAKIANARASGTQLEHPDHVSQIRAFYGEVEAMTQGEMYFRLWCCVYPVVVMLRLFKSFAAQPRLALVTNTFKAAWDDLVHFALVFFSVYLCMTVNAILFFGQDSIDFATIDRAFHSCFMAMLGSWDWDEMKHIGLTKAFSWLFAFMVIMVMLLLNMLLAILMESYSQVKALAENEASLAQQIQNMLRRAQQNRRGERVRLKDIWAALLKFENQDDDAMLKSERVIFPPFLVDTVPNIPKSQALRTLTTSQEAYDLVNQEPFDPGELQGTLMRTEQRMDNMVLCSSWLSAKLNGYHEELKEKGEVQPEPEDQVSEIQAVPSESSEPKGGGALGKPVAKEQSAWVRKAEDEEALQGAIETVKQIAQERTLELADGVAGVLGEEMQGLERRQSDQQRSMQDLRLQLGSLRRLIHKLGQTCEEVGQLASGLEGGPPASSTGERIRVEPPSTVNMAPITYGTPGAQQQQGLRMRVTRRNSEAFFNSRFTSAVGGTRDTN